MVDFFYKIYDSTKGRNALLQKLRVYSVLRLPIRTLANLVLPIYFRLTQHNPAYRLSTEGKTESRLIVSLTSFPARIAKVWLVVESLLRQTAKPDMIILWLSKEEIPDMASLPRKLLEQQERGLTIALREDNLRPHMKYYYTLTEHPESVLVTVDDDIFYRSDMLSNLLECAKEHPGCVVANYVHRMHWSQGRLCPYNDWLSTVVADGEQSSHLFVCGAGGVLYPPGILLSPQSSVLDKELIQTICPKADDVWLNAALRMNGIKAVKSKSSHFFLPVQNWNNKKLSSDNLFKQGNDRQIDSVRKYYIEKSNKDPFSQQPD